MADVRLAAPRLIQALKWPQGLKSDSTSLYNPEDQAIFLYRP